MMKEMNNMIMDLHILANTAIKISKNKCYLIH